MSFGACADHSSAPCYNLSAPVAAIAAGDEHSLAITRDGELYAWGKGAGALGAADDVAVPTRVPLPAALGAAAGGAYVLSAAGGADHSLAATATGDVWAWGAHGVGQLGIGCDALGGAAARPPALVPTSARALRALRAWRVLPATKVAAYPPFAPLDLSAPPPPPAHPPLLQLPPPHGLAGAAAPCRAACEANPLCGGFLFAPPAAGADAPVLPSRDCTFYNASAAEVYASAVPDASGELSLHLFEDLTVGGAALVAAGGEHSLAAAGLDGAARCPSSGEGGGAACGGAGRGSCAYSECRCLAPWLGDGCTAQGCDPACDANHGSCVLNNASLAGQPTYACACEEGWSGAACELPTCQKFGGLSCAGHGQCQSGAGAGAGAAHTCVCDAGWYGPACSRPLCGSAALQGCTGRGQCKCAQGGAMLAECAADGTEAQACKCEPGWLGAACDTPCPLTAGGAVCGGRGTCALSGAVAACSCDAMWSGNACEQPLCPSHDPDEDDEDAAELECGGSSRGVCTYTFEAAGGAVSGASCACEAGWAGADCGTMACEAGCSGHGACELDAATGVPGCRCDNGWAGADCSDGVGQRTLLYALSLGGGGLALLLCICCVGYCLYACGTGAFDGPGDVIMRQRWQGAHVASGGGALPVHIPSRGQKTRISPNL